MRSIFIRSFGIYFFLILILRVMGKRQMSQMEPSEFVVSMLIADLAASAMQEENVPLLNAAIPILVILLLELLLSTLSYHFIGVRKLLCGKPVILMENGEILAKNLKSTRVTPDELTEYLREKGVTDLSTVKYAILETNGQMSVLVDPQHEPVTAYSLGVTAEELFIPYTLICNGRLLQENLKLSGKSELWLNQHLSGRNCKISQVLLMTVDAQDHVYISLQETQKGC